MNTVVCPKCGNVIIIDSDFAVCTNCNNVIIS